MEYATEMGSGAMIYVPSFIKISSDILKLIRGDSQHGDIAHLLLFIKIRKSAVKPWPEIGEILYFRTYPRRIERKV
jgi:hypothetical protein